MQREIERILQEAYGDNATTPLDRVAAGRIQELYAQYGWLGGEELAYLVDAAGGEIRVSENLLMEPAPRLLRYQDPLSGDIVFQTQSEEEIQTKNPSPANREQAESRTVQSGPITVTTTKDSEQE